MQITTPQEEVLSQLFGGPEPGSLHFGIFTSSFCEEVPFSIHLALSIGPSIFAVLNSNFSLWRTEDSFRWLSCSSLLVHFSFNIYLTDIRIIYGFPAALPKSGAPGGERYRFHQLCISLVVAGCFSYKSDSIN